VVDDAAGHLLGRQLGALDLGKPGGAGEEVAHHGRPHRPAGLVGPLGERAVLPLDDVQVDVGGRGVHWVLPHGTVQRDRTTPGGGAPRLAD